MEAFYGILVVVVLIGLIYLVSMTPPAPRV